MIYVDFMSYKSHQKSLDFFEFLSYINHKTNKAIDLEFVKFFKDL